MMRSLGQLFSIGSVVLLSAALVACGDDDDDDSGTAGSGGVSTGGGGRSGSGGAAGGSAGTGTAGSGGSGGSTASGDIVDVAVAGGFDSLVAAVQQAELVEALQGDGPLTVFAPTDEAFAAFLGTQQLADIPKETLQAVLKYHVVADEVTASEVVALKVAPSLQGPDIRIKVDGGKVFLNGDSEVTMTDIQASNGVIHVINKVLVPPGDITAVAQAAGFTSLVAAVTKAELVTTLQGAGPFTVFAPTNAAFDTFLAGLGVTLNDLTKEQLTPILLYHVLPQKAYSESVVGLTSATTAQGEDIAIAVDGSAVTLNADTNVTATDVLASNGVIHVIDKVLVPPAED